MITPELRALVDAKAKAETADAELNHKWDSIRDDTMALIDKAALFIDEGTPDNRWPPSALLKIAYFACATMPRQGAEKDAAQWVLKMLDRARNLWVGGFHPNPLASDAELIRRYRR